MPQEEALHPVPDISEAPPVYKHKLSDHQVQGDATFKEINDHDRPYEGGVENAQKLPELNVFAEASGPSRLSKVIATVSDFCAAAAARLYSTAAGCGPSGGAAANAAAL